MKNSFFEDDQSKVRKKRSIDEISFDEEEENDLQKSQNVVVYLDLNYRSELLILQIRDLPSTRKWEILIQPLLYIYMYAIDREQLFPVDYYQYSKLISNWERDGEYFTTQFFSLFRYNRERMNGILTVYRTLWKRKLFVLRALDFRVRNVLERASEELRNDKEVILKAISYSCEEFQFASEQLRNDRDFVLKAIQISERSFVFVSGDLLSDRDFILRVLLEHADSDYITQVLDMYVWGNDREIMLELVKHNARRYFPYTSQTLRNDRELALIAVKQWGKALQYVSTTLKKDKTLLREAVKQLAPNLIDFSKDDMDTKEESLVLQYVSEHIDTVDDGELVDFVD